MKDTKLKISNDKVTVDLPSVLASSDVQAVVVQKGKLALAKVSLGNAFNGNRMITRDGLPHINLEATTLAEALERLLYPSVPPSVAVSLTNPVREYGNATDASLSFTVTQHSSLVTSITVNGDAFAFTSAPGEGVQYSNQNLVTLIPNQDNVFTVVALSKDNEQAAASASVVYRHANYAFLSDVDLLGLSDADTSAAIQQAASGVLSTGKQQSVAFTANNEFVNFAYLADYGLPSFTVNGLANTDFRVKQITYTNQYGYTASYYVVRTGSKLIGNYSYNLS